MPDHASEARHLAEAHRHIEQAEQRISRLHALITQAKARGTETREADRALAVMRDVLDTMRVCRATIMQTILDIDAGKYGE